MTIINWIQMRSYIPYYPDKVRTEVIKGTRDDEVMKETKLQKDVAIRLKLKCRALTCDRNE